MNRAFLSFIINLICLFIPAPKARRRIRQRLNKAAQRPIKIEKWREIPPINHKEIPIYIIVFNQLSYLKKLVTFLEKCGYQNIHFIDNLSTYPPLLEYLGVTKHTVHRMDKNYGHLVFWNSGKFDTVVKDEYYVLTDPDVVPDADCPADFMRTFYEILIRAPRANKVGCALKIDDLPDGYKHKSEVQEWESQWWKTPIENDMGLEIFDALIDTTFALYRPRRDWPGNNHLRALRIAGKYTARHLPWYECNAETEEQKLYKKTSNASTTWAHETPKIHS